MTLHHEYKENEAGVSRKGRAGRKEKAEGILEGIRSAQIVADEESPDQGDRPLPSEITPRRHQDSKLTSWRVEIVEKRKKRSRRLSLLSPVPSKVLRPLREKHSPKATGGNLALPLFRSRRLEILFGTCSKRRRWSPDLAQSMATVFDLSPATAAREAEWNPRSCRRSRNQKRQFLEPSRSHRLKAAHVCAECCGRREARYPLVSSVW